MLQESLDDRKMYRVSGPEYRILGVIRAVTQTQHRIHIMNNQFCPRIVDTDIQTIVIAAAGAETCFIVADQVIDGKPSYPLIYIDNCFDLRRIGFIRCIIKNVCQVDQIGPVVIFFIGVFVVTGVGVIRRVRTFVVQTCKPWARKRTVNPYLSLVKVPIVIVREVVICKITAKRFIMNI